MLTASSTRLVVGVLTCAVAAGLATASSADATQSAQYAGDRLVRARHTTAVDVSSKQAVAAAYRSRFVPALAAPVGFVGDIAGCRGSTTTTSLRALQDALNFARGLNHLGPVVFTSSLNAKAQQAAIMMAANDTLSHSLPHTARCWSATGAAAAERSNLAYRFPTLSPGQVVMQNLADSGFTMAPHRRWVLNPPTRTMGAGSTIQYNALYVRGATSRAQPDPAYVSWPSRGWFPNQLLPAGGWSLSGHAGTSFSHASVRVVRQGRTPRTVKVRRFKTINGYGRPTLVWRLPSGFDRSATYRVVVSGIRRSGSHRTFTHSYLVRLFRA